MRRRCAAVRATSGDEAPPFKIGTDLGWRIQAYHFTVTVRKDIALSFTVLLIAYSQEQVLETFRKEKCANAFLRLRRFLALLSALDKVNILPFQCHNLCSAKPKHKSRQQNALYLQRLSLQAFDELPNLVRSPDRNTYPLIVRCF